MKAHLLYSDRDFDWKWALEAATEREATRTNSRRYHNNDFNPHAGLPWNDQDLTSDLSLDTIFTAMAGEDDCVFEVARRVILSSVTTDIKTIRYRQGILAECLSHRFLIRELYAIAVEALDQRRGYFITSILSRHPDSVLRESLELMSKFIGLLKRLSRFADKHASEFQSDGWRQFFTTLTRDLGDDYLALVEHHAEQLKFRSDMVLLSAKLGKGNKGRDYLLHETPEHRWSWLEWGKSLFEPKEPIYSFTLHPRDEAGFQALATLRNRGISLVATALGESTDHVRSFFGMLRAELAFYIGCINLHERLTEKGEPVCFPLPAPVERRELSFRSLYDVGLTLNIKQHVIGNDLDGDQKNLVMITGANTGGKSTFLRSVGLAQLMMQSGMFVGAEKYSAGLCEGLFTHYKREEDTSMTSGKFDEELSRMSEIVTHIHRHALVLFNESFAATNEREGSEIARQIIRALLDRGIRVVCVTHLYELAYGFYDHNNGAAIFLRAERLPDGTRPFKLVEGKPLPTSHGTDLYESIFGQPADVTEADIPPQAAASMS